MTLNECYKTYSKDVYSVAYHYLGHKQDALDIMQEVFIKYSQHEADIQSHPNIKAWLLKVTINRCHDLKRRLSSFFKYQLNFIFEEASEAVEQKEIHDEDIARYLDYVDSKTKMVLVLKYMEEMSFEEISSIMNLKVGTLKSLASRGLHRIEKVINENKR